MRQHSNFLTSDILEDPALLPRMLVQEVKERLAGGNGHAPGVVRIEIPVSGVDLFAWLQAQPPQARWYWSGRKSDTAVAAVGVAAEVVSAETMGLDGLRQALSSALVMQAQDVRYYGGLRFDPAMQPDDDWGAYGTFRFVLPRFELHRRDGETCFICNLVPPRDRERLPQVLQAVRSLVFPAGPLHGTLLLPCHRADDPEKIGWQRNIEWALDAFETTHLEKVVLARKATFSFQHAPDPVVLLKQLQAATPNCFHYLFQPDPGHTFVGATPERLFRREGRTVWSEAVAGTRPRGTTALADEQLRDELLHSEKDQREHAYVRDSILAALAPSCADLRIDAAASEMMLAQGRHLVSEVQGVLHEGVDTLDLLLDLHPTPAVGGFPREDALEAIRRLEPFDRGWYAGPVGWVGKDAAEFAVALRCGLIRDRQLSLFSGAGIVRGSIPASEWDEIEYKTMDFVRVLGLDLRRAE